MTVASRNATFKVGIIFSALALLAGIAASVATLSVYGNMEMETEAISGGIFGTVFGWPSESRFLGQLLFQPTPLAVHLAVLFLAFYSIASIAVIYFFFEKTLCTEIIFVAFFALSFSIEVFRLVIPLGQIYELPSLYLLITSRIIIFGRYFGIFSLFAASVHATGYQSQQQRNTIIIVIVTALFISLSVPVDTYIWDSSLNVRSGYTSMFTLIEVGFFIITVASFFVATISRGSREFIFIGTGSLLALFGRGILLLADTWAGLPIGLCLLSAGTWLICTRLHKIYLWL